jgi:hypothetical protein
MSRRVPRGPRDRCARWHWQDTSENWPEMSSAAPAWFAKAKIATLHGGTAVQALS